MEIVTIPRNRVWVGLFLVVLPLFSIGNATLLFAQRGRNLQGELAKQSEIIEVPRPLQSLLQDAESALKREQWGEATLALGTLLGLESTGQNNQRPPASPGELGNGRGKSLLIEKEFGQDYFIDENADGVLRQSLKWKARDLLANLPEEGAKLAELRYGLTARSSLDEAIGNDDWNRIAAISTQYGFTEAGRIASWMMIERRMGQGEPYSAAVALERLLDQPLARKQFGKSILELGALCWKSAGHDRKGADLLKHGRAFWPTESLRIQGKQVSLSSSDEELRKVVEQIEVEGVSSVVRRTKDWRLPLGRIDGNGHGFAGAAMPVLRWDWPLHPAPQDRANILQVMKNRQGERTADLPSRIPLVVGPWVIARTYDQRTIGIDQRSGKMIWNSPFDVLPVRLSSYNPMDSGREYAGAERLLSAVWSDASVGQLSSDGVRLYGVCDLSAVQAAESLVPGANINIVRASQRSPTNVLRAWNLEREGSIDWEVGGENGLSEPMLSGALFLGVPTPHGDELFILAELNGEVYLVSLDAKNGKAKWWQQLVASTTIPIATDASRRGLAASPSVFGNYIVCPTLSGYIVAYDRSSHSLAWAWRYQQSGPSGIQFNGFRGTMNENFDPLQPHSTEYSPTISDGCVVMMPCEADAKEISAVDLATGEKLWTQFRDRWRYIGGVWKGKALLVSDHQAIAVDLRTGEKAWRQEIDLGTSKVVGRGARNAGRYYLPTSNQEIVEIDIENGKVLSRFQVEQPLGNLVATDHALVSLSPLAISYYALRSRLHAEIEFESSRDPESSIALSKQAEIHFADGDLEQALRKIRLAYTKAPHDANGRALLMKIGIAAIKKDFEKFGPEVQAFDRILAEGPDRADYLSVMIDGYLRQGDYQNATQKCLELADERSRSFLYTASSSDMIDRSNGLTVHADRWLTTQMERLWELSDGKGREWIARAIAPRIKSGMESGTNLKRKGYHHLLGLPPALDLAIEHSKELRRASEWATSEQLLSPLFDDHRDDRDRSVRSRLAAELFDLYRTAGRESAAMRMIDHVASEERARLQALSRPPEKDQDDALEGRPGFRGGTAMSNADLQALSKSIDDWPKGRVVVEGPSLEPIAEMDGVTVDLHFHEGDILKGVDIQIHSSDITIRNAWGAEAIILPYQLVPRQAESQFTAHIVHHMVYLELPNEIMAIDTLQNDSSNAIRWRRSTGATNDLSRDLDQNIWGESRKKGSNRYSILAASRHGIVFRLGDELTCIDLLKDERLWSRRGFSRDLCGGRLGHDLYLLEPSLSRFSRIDCRDGSIIDVQERRIGMNFRAQVGPHTLLSDRDTPYLKLWDPMGDRVLLERRFADKTVGTLVEGKYWVALEPNGSLYYWDIEQAKEFRHQLASEELIREIKEIKVARFGNRLLLMPFSFRYDPPQDVAKISGKRWVSGPLMALGIEDGRPLWPRPILCHKFAFPSSQCRTSPVISLVRKLQWNDSPERNVNQSSTSIALVDLRNGETLFESDVLRYVQGTGFMQRVYPSTNETVIAYRGQTVRLRFTDEESPPAPVSDLGNVSEDDLRRLSEGASLGRSNELDESFGSDPFGGMILPPGGMIPQPGFPGQGFPGQGFPPQGFPQQGFPPQGFPPQGFRGFGGQPGMGQPNRRADPPQRNR